MTDSNSFSSLLALVDSHLSKCSLQTNETPGPSTSLSIPQLNGAHRDYRGLSDNPLPSGSQTFPVSPFGIQKSPIKDILAEQVSNMLKARAKKDQEEKDKSGEKDVRTFDEDICFIDLVKAIQGPKYHYVPNNIEEESRESSPDFSFLDSDDDFRSDDESDDKLNPRELLPCNNDMSYMLKLKVQKGKCSGFGKVLTARYRKVAAPYIRERYESKVKRFDFQLRSPCDCIAEKLRRPTTYSLPNHVRFGMFDVKPIVNTSATPSL